MKLCIILIVLGVLAAGPFTGPQSVSAYILVPVHKLYAAIQEGDLAAVEREANAENINVIDDVGESSLHYAIKKNSTAMAEILIRKGANVNRLDLNGRSPLRKANDKGNKELVELLTNNGAVDNSRFRGRKRRINQSVD